jgi:hypothetical protein
MDEKAKQPKQKPSPPMESERRKKSLLLLRDAQELYYEYVELVDEQEIWEDYNKKDSAKDAKTDEISMEEEIKEKAYEKFSEICIFLNSEYTFLKDISGDDKLFFIEKKKRTKVLIYVSVSDEVIKRIESHGGYAIEYLTYSLGPMVLQFVMDDISFSKFFREESEILDTLVP